MTFLLAPKRKILFFVLKVVCPQYIFRSIDRFWQLLFLGLSKCLPESDFYLPRAIGEVYM